MRLIGNGASGRGKSHLTSNFGNGSYYENRFWKQQRRDPQGVLLTKNPEDFKGFLDWRIIDSRTKKRHGIQKLSSIMTVWKLISILYAEVSREYIPDELLIDIKNVCASLQNPSATNILIVSSFQRVRR
jgi:hypothetical protein